MNQYSKNLSIKPGDIICGSTIKKIWYERRESKGGNIYYRGYANCICHCGKSFTRDMANLSCGKKKGIMSCGCMRGKAKVVPKTVKKGKYFSQPYLTYLQKHSYRNGKQKVFQLTIEILDELYEKQNGKCYWSGEKLTIPDVNKSFSPNRKEWNCSVDRINSKFGYTKDNVVLCTGKVNVCKMDLLPEDFIQMCNNVAKTHPR